MAAEVGLFQAVANPPANALTSHDAEVIRGAYLSMNLVSRFFVILDALRCLG